MRGRFHNTIQADNQLIALYESDFKRDEDAVLEVLKRLKKAAWFEAKGCLEWMNEDSLKRALSDLANVKRWNGEPPLKMDMNIGNMVMGPNGKRCHRYILIEKR